MIDKRDFVPSGGIGLLDSFLTVTGQVATLFLMMGVGFVLGRLGRLTGAALDQLSFLLRY